MKTSYTQKYQEIISIYQKNAKQAEYLLACWTTDDEEVWEGMKVKPLPQPPEDLRAYEQMNAQHVKVPAGFFRQPDIQEYLSLKNAVARENEAHLLWLRDCLVALPPEEKERRKKITERIFDFGEEGYR